MGGADMGGFNNPCMIEHCCHGMPCIGFARYGEAELKGGMGGADMGGFNNPFDLFEQC